MKTRLWIALAGIVLALTACGGGGPTVLGDFPAITKTEGDEPFKLTAPTSKSPGAFTFTSSNPAVATIDGDMVTIVAAGTTTITASQEAKATYSAASASAVLTVNPKPCVAPATRENGVCVPPQTTGNYVTLNGSTWMPVSFYESWENASAFCDGTTINGQTGWRLPMELELSELRDSGALKDQGWSLFRTWTSTEGATGTRKTVNLADGVVSDQRESDSNYVTCVRKL